MVRKSPVLRPGIFNAQYYISSTSLRGVRSTTWAISPYPINLSQNDRIRSLPGAVLSCSAKKVPKECGIGEALRNCSRNYMRPPLCTPPATHDRYIVKYFGAVIM